jgi:hypothetical protein
MGGHLVISFRPGVTATPVQYVPPALCAHRGSGPKRIARLSFGHWKRFTGSPMMMTWPERYLEYFMYLQVGIVSSKHAPPLSAQLVGVFS